jgi:hypothetical protein
LAVTVNLNEDRKSLRGVLNPTDPANASAHLALTVDAGTIGCFRAFF